MQVRENINKYIILTFLFVMASGLQLKAQYSSSQQNELKIQEPLPTVLSLYNVGLLKKPNDLNIINPGKKLGFICKWENKNDGKTKFPKRFRLGTLEYVNKLESKNK